MKSLRALRPALIIPACAVVIAAAFAAPGGVSRQGKAFVFRTPAGSVRVLPVTQEIFYISDAAAPADARAALPSASVLTDSAAETVLTASPEGWTLSSPTTSLRIDRATGLATLLDSAGRILSRQTAPFASKSGVRSIAFFRDPSESIYGAGERAHAYPLNDDSLKMWNRPTYGYGAGDERISQMNITMPYFASDRGYGILIDDFAEATMLPGDTIRYETVSEAPIGVWLINGNGTLGGVTDSFTRLTGRQPLPPFWSLGYITSRYGYHDEKQTREVVDSLKSAGYPVDGIVFDLYWYGKETDMGRLEWDASKWPDHKKLLSDLRDKGIRTVLISQPYINKIGAIDRYNELDSLGLLTHDAQGRTNDVTTWVGEAGMFDVSNPATRSWLWNRYKTLTDDGVEGWWGDLGEPEQHPLTIVHDNGLAARQYHNVYGNEWSRIIAEGFAKDYPARRLMLMMRGGTAGLQRYNVFPWSGDVARSWAGLQAQLPIMLNSGLSGLGYMSSDIGGFAVDAKTPVDPELYVRWLQLGTFSPVLRTHAQLKPEPYNYPAQEKTIKRFIKMRYEWLPYNYTLAYENATTGAPFVRPLNFSDSTQNPGTADEYLWGDEVLVAPVITRGAKARKVTFPKGARWIDWYNNELSYKGGTSASVYAPLDRMPLFVREGSFIPQYAGEIDNTEQYDPQFITVRYYPSDKDTSYTLFDDDRKSPDSLSDGAYQLTTFSGRESAGDISVSLSTNRQGYEGMPQFRMITLLIEGVKRAPKAVTASDGTPLPECVSEKAIRQTGWAYDRAHRVIAIRFNYDYSDLTIKIDK